MAGTTPRCCTQWLQARASITHYFFAFGGTSQEQVDGFAKALLQVLDEDKFATEEIKKFLRQSENLPSELMLKSEGTAVFDRRLLQDMIDQGRKQEAGQPA